MRALLVAVLVSAPALACAQAAPWNDESWWEEWGQASMASGSTAVLSAPFSSPGCYQQALPLVLIRGSTRSCGGPTCTADQACVTSAGASFQQADNDILSPAAIAGTALTGWAQGQVGSSLPGITADQATCPDGLTTGDRVAFGATTTAGNYSIVYQQRLSGSDGLAESFDVDVRSVGASGTLGVELTNSAGAAGSYTGCAVNTSTWTRCTVTYTPASNATFYVGIGTDARAWTGAPAVQPALTVDICNTRMIRSPAALAWRPDPQGGDVLVYRRAMPQSGSGSATVTPEWAAAASLVDRTVFDNGEVSLKYVQSVSKWRLTAGGQTADSAVQAFGASTAVNLAWHYAQGGLACVLVDGSETCSGGNVASFTPWSVTYVGGSPTGGGDLAVKALRFAGSASGAKLTTASTIYALGDSITAGLGVTTPYPSTLQTLLGGGWTVTNGGVNSDRVDQMFTRERSTGYGKQYVVVLAGINNLIQGRKDADAWVRLRSLYEEIRASGSALIAVTVLPFKSSTYYTAEREAGRVALNTKIKAYCATGAATCVDADADFDDGTQTMKVAYRQADFLHPNQTGADRLAALVRAVLP